MPFNIAAWTPADVLEWLKTVGMEKFAEFFRDNEIDGETLLSIGKEDIYYLVKVFDEIFTLKEALKLERLLIELKESNRSVEVQYSLMDNAFSTASSVISTTETNGVIAVGPMSTEPKWNEGGLDEIVRGMEDAFPDYCWRLKSVDVLLKDLIPQNTLCDGDVEKAFPAYVTHAISPVELYVRPTFIQPMLDKLQHRLQDVYSESTMAVPKENIFLGMPCVTRYKLDGNWYRAQVVDVVGSDEAPVRFIDFGNRQYSTFDELKPLGKELGRLPPAALHCRIKGVRERTLEQKVLDAFHDEIDSLGYELFISVVSSFSDPFLVEVFNKYTKENIGRKYLPKEPLCPKMPSSDAWKMKIMREMKKDSNGGAGTSCDKPKVFASDLEAFMEGAFGENSSSDDPEVGEIKRANKKLRKLRHQEQLMAQGKWPPKIPDDDERTRFVTMPNSDVVFQRRFRKQKKPLVGHVDVKIKRVVSTKEIYVQILALDENTDALQQSLLKIYGDHSNSVPALPTDFVAVDNVCAVYSGEDLMWYRCRIVEVSYAGAVLQDVDTGKRLPIISKTDYGRIKVLLRTSNLDKPPIAFLCRIDHLCDRQPTETESTALREFLQVGTMMKAEFERTREPWRVRLFFPETMLNFAEFFEVELVKLGIWEVIENERRPCTAVMLWQQPKYVEVDTKPKCDTGLKRTNSVPTMATIATTSHHGEAAKTSTNKYKNDIDAVLCGSITAAGYSDEENELPVRTAPKRPQTSRAVDIDEEERDEKASVGEFCIDKKTYVEKWLESASERSAGGCASAPAAPQQKKRTSVAAMYNPDLSRKPMGQRNGKM